MRYINTEGIPLAVAVFLASDFYDYNDDPYTISATTLLKPLRQIILSGRVPQEDAHVDLASMAASRIGTAIHDGFERSWTTNHKKALEALGYPKIVIERIKVNPDPYEVDEDTIPVYLEQRLEKCIDPWKVTGKFDFIGDGKVQDVKSTSVYTYINQTNANKYILQGSIYRWLDPKRITADELDIHYIFTDWKPTMAKADPGYPKERILTQTYPLMSLEETDHWVRNKLAMIDKYWKAPEEEIPQCNDEDLWRSEPVFKYYKNPDKLTRSTKNFDNKHDAMMRFIQDGSIGLVKEVPGQVTACKYCSAFPICTQKDQLILNGELILA